MNMCSKNKKHIDSVIPQVGLKPHSNADGSDLPPLIQVIQFCSKRRSTTTYGSFHRSHGRVTDIAPVLSTSQDPSGSKWKKCSLHRLLSLHFSRSAVKPMSHLSGCFPIRCGSTLKEEADLKAAGLPKFQIEILQIHFSK